jgi:hypothetical protein
LPADRNTWTDERLDERMNSIDGTMARFTDELAEFRREHREDIQHLRSEVVAEMRLLRSDLAAGQASVQDRVTAVDGRLASVQDRLVQIGFGLVGVLVIALCSLAVGLL